LDVATVAAFLPPMQTGTTSLIFTMSGILLAKHLLGRDAPKRKNVGTSGQLVPSISQVGLSKGAYFVYFPALLPLRPLYW